MKLSPHFHLDEFCVSQTATRLGKPIQPTPNEVGALTRLCESVLEVIRTRLNRAMFVSSGLRPVWLNEAIGGSEGSAHTWGGAADVRAAGMSASVFARWIVNNCPDVPYDQVIDEFGQWVHISIAPPGQTPRKQYLIAQKLNGKTIYLTGSNPDV